MHALQIIRECDPGDTGVDHTMCYTQLGIPVVWPFPLLQLLLSQYTLPSHLLCCLFATGQTTCIQR